MIYDLLTWLSDSLMALWFFRSIREEGNVPPKMKWLALPVLILLLPLYFRNMFAPSQILRFAFRWFAVGAFLRLGWRISFPRCAYFSAIFNASLLALQTVQPLVTELLSNTPEFVSKLLNLSCQFAGLTFVSSLVPFEKIRLIRRTQVVVIAAVSVLVLYSKSTMRLFVQGRLTLPVEVSLYPVVVLLLSFAVLAFFDRYYVLLEEQRMQALVNMSREYQYQNLQAQVKAQEDVRRIYHDMKNHLVTLRAMSGEKQESYIDGVLKETEGYQDLFDTGIPTLDGLLRAKLSEARAKNVQFSVNLDLTSVSYVDPVDICAIFGNIIDNAIEASEKLPNPEDRFIELKSGDFADQTAIRIINTYVADSIRFKDNQTMETTKPDKGSHGIGLSSVLRSVEKYGGVLSTHTTADSRLILTILLPKSNP